MSVIASTTESPAHKPKAAAGHSPKSVPRGVSTEAGLGLPLFLSKAPPTGELAAIQRQPTQHSSESPQAFPIFVQAKLTVNEPGDPFEQEADLVAERVMRSSEAAIEPVERNGVPGPRLQRKCAACSAGSPCPQCAEEEDKIQLKPATGAPVAPRQVSLIPPDAGSPLSESVRSKVEPILGTDLRNVRVHDSPAAQRSAAQIQAKAFTHQDHIWLGAGQSSEDLALMSHEATHVAQQTGRANAPGIQRQQSSGGTTTTSITPQFAQTLDDTRLQTEINATRAALGHTATDSPEYRSLRSNLDILEAEVGLRSMPGLVLGARPTALVPRPPGLPLNGGYMLQPIDLPPALVNAIPEGQLSDLPAASVGPTGSSGPGTGVSATSLVAPLSGPLYSANAAANASLMRSGFLAAGENSVGLVAIPRWTPTNAVLGRVPLFPESISIPGHTAMIVRVNGELHVFGMAPASSARATLSYTRDLLGQPPGQLRGAITDDAWLFTKRSARSVEWAVDAETARKALSNARGATPPDYTFRPNAQSSGMNCGLWACSQIETSVGQPVTTRGGVPVTDMPGPRATGQGQLMRTLGEGDVAPIGRGGAVIGEMSTGMKVLKVGGRVFLVIGVAVTAYDIATAKPEERARTAARELTGFAAGFAAGALAGLACGPGAPVCSVVLGLGFGIVGTLVGREVGEGVYDAATGRRSSNDYVDECDRPQPLCPNCHQRVCPPRNRFGSLSMPSTPFMRTFSDDDRAMMEYIRSLTPPSTDRGRSSPLVGPRTP